MKALQHSLQELNERLDEWEMKANWQKTRVMRIGRKHEVCNVKVKGERVEQVKEMKYLGTMISSDGSMGSEVEQRIYRNGVKDGGGNWKHSAGKEGIDKRDKTESGECYGDSHADLRV